MPKPAALGRTSFYNNPFVGLFFKASDKLALVPSGAPHKSVEALQASLGVPVAHLLLSQSNLLGLFSVLNSSGAVVSSLAEKEEVAKLKAHGLNIFALKDLSPGNNLVANDKAALASYRVAKEELKHIGDCLGVEVFQQHFVTPGIITSTVVTNKGLLAHNEITETELKFLEKTFKVRGSNGTTNNGAPFNALAIVANSNGAIVGEATSGFEMQRIYEALYG